MIYRSKKPDGEWMVIPPWVKFSTENKPKKRNFFVRFFVYFSKPKKGII